MQDTNSKTTAITRRPEEAVGRWSPWNEMTELRRHMDDLFSRAFGYTPLSRLLPKDADTFEPDVDIYETGEKVRVFASLSGYTPDQIHVEATNESITISGERPALYEDDKARRHRHGNVSGFNRFFASYTLPCEIDPNKVTASFKNGILQLEMPKTEQARTKAVKIDINKE